MYTKKPFMALAITALSMLAITGCKKSDSETPSPAITTASLSTASISTFTQITAICGGTITEDGGAPVTERGVCWSTANNPTIADAQLAIGSGKGTFSDTITGLALGTKYYVRAYATNSKGTSYGAEQSFTTDATLAVGIPYAGGIIFYLDPTKKHGLVCALEDIGSGMVTWGCSGTKINGADSTSIGRGAQNTLDILAGCSDMGIAADICAKYDANGYNDWFLPSEKELMLMCTELYQKNIGGFKYSGYWSSTEDQWDPKFANMIVFSGANSQSGGKNNPNNVRAVRAF